MLILKVILSLKVKKGDIMAAFGHADVEEGKNIYVEMPHGFKMQDTVLQLKKMLYGLRQCPSAFWLYLAKKMNLCSMKLQCLIPVFSLTRKSCAFATLMT